MNIVILILSIFCAIGYYLYGTHYYEAKRMSEKKAIYYLTWKDIALSIFNAVCAFGPIIVSALENCWAGNDLSFYLFAIALFTNIMISKILVYGSNDLKKDILLRNFFVLLVNIAIVVLMFGTSDLCKIPNKENEKPATDSSYVIEKTDTINIGKMSAYEENDNVTFVVKIGGLGHFDFVLDTEFKEHITDNSEIFPSRIADVKDGVDCYVFKSKSMGDRLFYCTDNKMAPVIRNIPYSSDSVTVIEDNEGEPRIEKKIYKNNTGGSFVKYDVYVPNGTFYNLLE